MTEDKIQWGIAITRPWSILKHTPFVTYLSKELPAKLGVALTNHLLIYRGRNICTSYFDLKEWGRLSQKLVKLSTNIEYFYSWAKSCRENATAIIDTSKIFRKENLGEKSLEELHQIFLEYYKPMKEWAFYGWPLWVFERILEKVVKEELQVTLKDKGRSEDFTEYFQILTTKVKSNEDDIQEGELLEIALEFKKQGGFTLSVNKMLEYHKEKYQWYPVYDYTLSPWDINYFKRRIEELKEVAEEELKRIKSTSKVRRRIDETLNKISADEKLREHVEVLQEYLYIRSVRTNALRKAYYNLLPFIEEIANRIGWDKSLIPFLTDEELRNYLKSRGIPEKMQIENRKEDFLLIKINGEDMKIVTGKENINRIKERELGREEIEIRILKGVGVYHGEVKGIVKIIETPDQEKKMEKGDILVSAMTSPDMHHIIERASAIVTDEGGITCHAAIISRELNIPCVIGTEIATKVLKDGEKVKVDSKNGIVERLS